MAETEAATAAVVAEMEVSPTEEKVDVKMKEKTAEETKTEEVKVDIKAGDTKDTVTAVVSKEEETMPAESETPAKEEEKTGGKKKRKKREASTPASEVRHSKRARKSAATFKPEDFAAPKDAVNIIEGRGTTLADIPNVKEKIESYSNNSDEMIAAHKFVYRANIGKPASNHRHEHLLAFSGYLPALVEGEDENERDKSDQKIETKMTQKAYKLVIRELKMICDVFDIDRTPSTIDKDELVERLCNFLAEPNAELTNKEGSKPTKSKAKNKAKKKKKATNKKKKEEEEEEEETEDETEDEESDNDLQGAGMPSDKQLRKWVKAYCACFNLDNVSINHALETASDKFGVDIASKKSTLKTLLTEEM